MVLAVENSGYIALEEGVYYTTDDNRILWQETYSPYWALKAHKMQKYSPIARKATHISGFQCDLSRWMPRQRELHSKSLYCD